MELEACLVTSMLHPTTWVGHGGVNRDPSQAIALNDKACRARQERDLLPKTSRHTAITAALALTGSTGSTKWLRITACIKSTLPAHLLAVPSSPNYTSKPDEARSNQRSSMYSCAPSHAVTRLSRQPA